MKLTRYLILAAIATLAAITVHAQHPAHPQIRWAKMGAYPTTPITFSPDGSIIGHKVYGGYLFTETATGAIRALVPGTIERASFSPDGNLVACAAYDRSILLLDGHTFQPLDTLGEFDIKIEFVEFSPDGRRLLAMSGNRILQLWNMETRKLIFPALMPLPSGKDYNDLAFSPDGSRIMGLQGNRVVFYNSEDGALIDSVTIPGASAVRFSPDGDHLLVATRTGETWSLIVWNYRTMQSVRTFPLPIEGTPANTTDPADITITPDGRYAAASNGRASWLQFIDIETGDSSRILYFNALLYTATFSPDGRYLAVGGYGLHIHLLDAATWGYLRELPLGQQRLGRWIVGSLDGRMVATSSGPDEDRVRVWDVMTGEMKRMFTNVRPHNWPISFTPNGAGVMLPFSCELYPSAGEMRSIASGEAMGTFPCDRNHSQPTIAAIHPDGRHVVVFAKDEWRPVEVPTGWPGISGSHRGIHVLSLSRDGQILATGGRDSMIRIWNFETRGEIAVMESRWDYDHDQIALTPTGSHLLQTVGGYDNRPPFDIRVRGIGTDEDRVLSGAGDYAEALQVSPDGKWVLAACGDGKIYVWRFATGELVYTYSSPWLEKWESWAGMVIAPDFSSFTTLGQSGMIANWSTAPIKSLSAPEPHRESLKEMNLTAYPNPASQGTEIRFNLPAPITGSLRIYNALGQPVATLAEGAFESGEHSYSWTPQVPPGLYIISLRTEKGTLTHPFICAE